MMMEWGGGGYLAPNSSEQSKSSWSDPAELLDLDKEHFLNILLVEWRSFGKVPDPDPDPDDEEDEGVPSEYEWPWVSR